MTKVTVFNFTHLRVFWKSVIFVSSLCNEWLNTKLGFTPCKVEQPLQGMELKGKKSAKRLKHTGNLLQEKPTVHRCLLILGLKPFIGQRKAFYRQRIPEPSYARKETVDTDILVTSRNSDKKIMQSIWIASRPLSRKRKWKQLSHLIPIEKT